MWKAIVGNNISLRGCLQIRVNSFVIELNALNYPFPVVPPLPSLWPTYSSCISQKGWYFWQILCMYIYLENVIPENNRNVDAWQSHHILYHIIDRSKRQQKSNFPPWTWVPVLTYKVFIVLQQLDCVTIQWYTFLWKYHFLRNDWRHYFLMIHIFLIIHVAKLYCLTMKTLAVI